MQNLLLQRASKAESSPIRLSLRLRFQLLHRSAGRQFSTGTPVRKFALGPFRSNGHMELSAFDLMVGSRHERTAGRVRAGELLPLGGGRYLPTHCIPPSAPGWEVRRIVSKARAIAAVVNLVERNPGILTADAALLLRGVPTLHSAIDVVFWRARHKTNLDARLFPEVEVEVESGVQRVPTAASKELLGAPHGWGDSDSDDYLLGSHGVRVARMEQAVLDLVRYSHPLQAFVNASAAFRALSRFDKFRQVESRRRAERVRGRLLRMLEALKARRGNPRARLLLELIDPGMDSPAEGVVLWALKVLLRGNTSRRALHSTQHQVFAANNEYFLDIGFPYARLGIEFDGATKLHKGRDSQRAFLRRQADLTRDGWHLCRVTTADYLDLERLFRLLARDLRSRQVEVQAPGGPLWPPAPADLLDPARLF